MGRLLKINAVRFLVALALALGTGLPLRAGTAERVVVLVWGGLRPDSVSETSTPALFALARQGVLFSRHHAVFPSATDVNGVALATGDFPGRNGLFANFEFRPDLDPAGSVATGSPATARKGDDLTGGGYLGAPTLAERLRQAGIATIVAGTTGTPFLHDRFEKGDGGSVLLWQGKALPAAALDPLTQALGPFPAQATHPNMAQDAWTTRAVVEQLWKGRNLPKFTLLWLSDPSGTQHASAPGADTALQALRASDANLSRVLAALDVRGLRETTDVIVASDHGCSTISRTVGVVADLAAHGFPAVKSYRDGTPPKGGDIVVVPNGGFVSFYVKDRDPAAVGKLVAFLQRSDYAGVLLTRDFFPGTFPLARIGLDGAAAPDVVCSLRWSNDMNHDNVAGLITSDGSAPGRGIAGTMSRYDLRATLIAAGPDFRKGWIDPAPSGTVDLAPTIAALLNLDPASGPPMDGRVLSEAFRPAGKEAPADAPAGPEEKVTASAPAGEGTWSQYLQLRKVGNVTYLDEGNGGWSAGGSGSPAP